MNRYSVRTIPRLIVCKPDGASITTKGRSEIESRLAGAAFNWIESSRPKPKQLVNGFVSGLKIDYSQITFNHCCGHIDVILKFLTSQILFQ